VCRQTAPQSVAACIDVAFFSTVRGLLIFTDKEQDVVVTFIDIIVPGGFFLYTGYWC